MARDLVYKTLPRSDDFVKIWTINLFIEVGQNSKMNSYSYTKHEWNPGMSTEKWEQEKSRPENKINFFHEPLVVLKQPHVQYCTQQDKNKFGNNRGFIKLQTSIIKCGITICSINVVVLMKCVQYVHAFEVT